VQSSYNSTAVVTRCNGAYGIRIHSTCGVFQFELMSQCFSFFFYI
jgi:hypothetical protein